MLNSYHKIVNDDGKKIFDMESQAISHKSSTHKSIHKK